MLRSSFPGRSRRRWAGFAVAAFLAVLVLAATAGARVMDPARRARIEASPQWDGRAFRHPEGVDLSMKGDRAAIMRRFFFERGRREPAAPLPVATRRRADFADPPPDGVRATWLGHSTMLLEVEGVRMLTDPVWAERASPVSWAGPRRFHPPPLALDELPDLDAVLLSHDHFDHLDKATVRALGARGVPFVAPLGVGGRLEGWGVPAAQVTELDWWASALVAGLTITAAPARHFSGRGTDRNRTLWASFAIAGRTRKVYFGGDGGQQEAFREIGSRLGPFDLVMLEIGAFDPAWADVHLGPEGAAEAWRRLGGGLVLPIHWGTFNLGLHAWDAPPEEMIRAAEAAGAPLAIPRIGGSVGVGDPPSVEPWWRGVE